MKVASTTIYLLLLIFLIGSGCSSRETSPIFDADSTLVYPAIEDGDVEATITFFRKDDSQSGSLLGVGRYFSIMEDGDVRANVEIKNRFAHGNRELMFHLDWIDPDGNSFFQKRIDLLPDDSTSTLNSSISTSPEIRQPGEYCLRIYYFRELIAEKKFELFPVFQLHTESGEAISAKTTLYRAIGKKSGKLIGIDSTFTLKDRRNLRAIVDLKNRFVYGHRELLFRMEWTDSTGQAFFTKGFDLGPNDTVTSLHSSISISPENRQVGKYSLRVFLFHELIEEKDFELQKEAEVVTPKFDLLKVDITLYSSLDNESSKRIGKGEIFNIEDKARVYAQIEVSGRAKHKNQKLSFTLKWTGPDGQSFYEKDIDLLANDPETGLGSSISIFPTKREPGSYSLQVYLSDKFIAAKKFELIVESKNHLKN